MIIRLYIQKKNNWLLLEIHSVNKLVKRLTIQLEKRGLRFFLQMLNNYFGVGREEKNSILNILLFLEKQALNKFVH
jgi:hypothetical protein